MRRFIVVACLLAHSAHGAPQPQRGVQLGGGPRPVTYGTPQASQQSSFGPNYSQQLTFGPSDAGTRATSPGAYRSPQPILLQQGNPSPTPFPNFHSASSFQSGPSRGPNRGPSTPSPANDDEYEYEDEEEAKPVAPQIQQRPVQRAPVRVSQPISFSQGPQRLVVPQSQPQQQAQGQRQRQPTPQRQSIAPQPQQYSPQPQTPRVQVAAAPQQSRGQQLHSFGLDGKRTRLTTPAPVQTVNRYNRQNDDGSITWGYENEDGTFKEETIGADCVVKGKYGYVDPDGQKREYEYQSGNPCDPNKRGQEEEEEEEASAERPGQQQQIQGVIHARPRPVQQQQRRPQPQQQQQYAPQPQYVN